MPAVTPQGGFPYPVAGDTLYETLMELLPSLATKLDTYIMAPGTVGPTDPETAYPVGISSMLIYASGAPGWASTTGFSGYLLTVRYGSNAAQLLFNRYVIWYRNSLYSNWTTWMQVYGQGVGPIQASGKVTLMTASNGLAGANVTFPSGRFSAAPVFQPTVDGGAGAVDYNVVGYANTASSGFVAVKGPASTEIKVNWTAVQGA